jgi:pyruvate dehydrogenase E1 component
VTSRDDVDIDPAETQEWLDSLDAVIDGPGRMRARYLMLRLLERARAMQVGVPSLTTTDYINTISPEQEPWFPGDEDIERRIRAYPALERRDDGPPRAAPGHRRRRPHLDLRVGGDALRGGLQPLLPRQGPPRRRRPDLLPGPRLPRHVRPRLPRGPHLSEDRLDGFRQEKSHVVDGLRSPCRPTRTRA